MVERKIKGTIPLDLGFKANLIRNKNPLKSYSSISMHKEQGQVYTC
jgi:hypothetical protein